jgi:choline dehydrogenase
VRGARRVGARAERQVVVAAGAIGSPQLLMLSGVGPPDVLSRFDVPVVAPLKGVGRNLQDHPVAGVAYYCKQPISLANAESLASLIRYALTKKGPLSSNVAEAGAFLRSSPELEAPDLQFHFAPVFFVEHGFVRPKGHGFSLGPALLTPASRGHLTLGSADPFAPPIIYGNHLGVSSDAKRLLLGFEMAREIAHARAFDRFRGTEYLPGASASSPADLEAHLRATVELLYHPSGTCRMGNDELAVVDSELRVRQVEGLRIADASVMPTVTRGNTNAPTIMIAERLADWLR